MDIKIALTGFFGFLAVMVVLGVGAANISPSMSSNLITGAVVLAFAFIGFGFLGKIAR